MNHPISKENRLFTTEAEGRVGIAIRPHRVDPVPIGAPAGEGGPGNFAPTGPLGSGDSPWEDSESAFSPVASQAKAPNPPPATVPRSLGEKAKSISSVHDVLIDASIVSDRSVNHSRIDAQTSFNFPNFTFPGYEADDSGTITKFKGKFRWRGTITIQTTYGSKAKPADLSCYGRGTTPTDRNNGDITLGFHESCHRADFEAYLKDHPLPDLPDIRVGMTKQEYADEDARFRKEFKAYQDSMNQDTKTRTDEVGHTLSTVLKTNQCYVHQVP